MRIIRYIVYVMLVVTGCSILEDKRSAFCFDRMFCHFPVFCLQIINLETKVDNSFTGVGTVDAAVCDNLNYF